MGELGTVRIVLTGGGPANGVPLNVACVEAWLGADGAMHDEPYMVLLEGPPIEPDGLPVKHPYFFTDLVAADGRLVYEYRPVREVDDVDGGGE